MKAVRNTKRAACPEATGQCESAPYTVKEFKVVALRDAPCTLRVLERPEQCAAYWREQVANHPYYEPTRECLVVLLLNSRKRIFGHHLVGIGTLDTVLLTAREVFRAACVMAAKAVVLMHNHPSGDPVPSDGDIQATRDMIRAGQLMGIEVLDHVIMGQPAVNRGHVSLRDLGYFNQ